MNSKERTWEILLNVEQNWVPMALGSSAGVELRFGLRIGLDESLQDRILTKARKRLSRQNSTKLCVNLWENVQHKNA